MTKKLLENSQIDHHDRKILDALCRDGRLSITALAGQVGLSKTPCHNRLNRLRKDGYIVGFRAVLNPKKLQRAQVAFITVKLKETREATLDAFNDAVHQIPEIEQCHMIAGSFDYLLKVRSKNMSAFRTVLGEQISTLPQVASTSTFVSMDTIKDNSL